MISYIPFETALMMLANAYLASVTLLLAVSYIGWVVLETTEKANTRLSKPKWFV